MPSSAQPVNFESVLMIAAGTNSGYRPHGRWRTRSTTSRLRSAGNSNGFSFWSNLTSASKCLRVYAVRPRTSGFITPDGDRSCMSSQSFSDRELLNHRPELLDCAPGIADDTGPFHKVRHAQGRKESRCPVRRQHMAGSRKVIADNRVSISTNEHGAGIGQLVGDVLGLGH